MLFREIDHHTLFKYKKLIFFSSEGYDTIDVKAANERGVFVANCPGKNAVAVTELCFGLMLSADRRIHLNNQLLKVNKIFFVMNYLLIYFFFFFFFLFTPVGWAVCFKFILVFF